MAGRQRSRWWATAEAEVVRGSSVCSGYTQASWIASSTFRPGETVIQRPRPELDPIGLHAGDFFWFPRAELDESYNNNIFATPSPTTSDFITTLQPSFDLLSSFPRNALNLHGGAALQYYAR